MEIQNWKEILSPYELAVDEIVLKVRHIMKEYADQGVYCPIENVLGRVKSISSILAKAKKKNVPIEEITERIEDIAGIRITRTAVTEVITWWYCIRFRPPLKPIRFRWKFRSERWP